MLGVLVEGVLVDHATGELMLEICGGFFGTEGFCLDLEAEATEQGLIDAELEAREEVVVSYEQEAEVVLAFATA